MDWNLTLPIINMTKPKISVIFPVYNAEKFLFDSIDSILNQTFKDFELIIINDGSTDKSEEIILSFKDDRIIYIKNEENLKLIKTLNVGVKRATGFYISRMDADDIAFPNMFEKQLDIFKENVEIDIVNIQTYLMSNNGTSYRKNRAVIKVHSDVHKHVVFFQNLISHPGVMVKAGLLKEYRYNENEIDVPFQDVDLWYRILSDGAKCYTTEDFLLFYRNNPNGITNTLRKNRFLKRIEYCKDILAVNYCDIFSDKEIELILGKYQNVKYQDLISLYKNLQNFISYIKKNKNISPSGLTDLFFWKTHLIFITSFKSLVNSNLKNSFLIFLFIIYNLPYWISNKKWRINLIEVGKSIKSQKK